MFDADVDRDDTAAGERAPELVPARMLNETLYCERLVALEWGVGEFRDNVFTEEGRRVHRRADRPMGDLPLAGGARAVDGPVARALWLTSERLGITARIDVIDEAVDGSLVPIEYKRGRAPALPEGAWLPERAQLCAHVLILRDHGYRVDHAAIYYAEERRRVRIDIDDDLIAITLRAAARAREIVANGEMPPPLEDSPKCPGCSLVSLCLPDETNLLKREGAYDRPDVGRPDDDGESELGAEQGCSGIAGDRNDPAGARSGGEEGPLPTGIVGSGGTRTARAIAIRHDIGTPLYVVEHGALLAKKDRVLEVRKEGKVLASQPLIKVSQVSVFANAQVTVGARNELASRGIPICQFTSGGWFRSISHGFPSGNVRLRIEQFRAALDERRALALARRFVEGKVRNARTLLRRNARDREAVERSLRELRQRMDEARRVESLASLLGVEGNAARAYFAALPAMIRRESGGMEGGEMSFDFRSRNRRPPKDPVNALLSFVYALLVKDLSATLLAVGFDPCLGFFHQPRHGRPSLALDLAEEFRPLIGDSVVLQVINNGEVGAGHFERRGAACGLTATGRRQVLAAYERRLEMEVTHPIFGYALSYRRVFELQARLLARAVQGEIADYPPFVTR